MAGIELLTSVFPTTASATRWASCSYLSSGWLTADLRCTRRCTKALPCERCRSSRVSTKVRLGRTTRFGLQDKSVLTLLGETGLRLDITCSLCRMLLYSFRQRYLRKTSLGKQKYWSRYYANCVCHCNYLLRGKLPISAPNGTTTIIPLIKPGFDFRKRIK